MKSTYLQPNSGRYHQQYREMHGQLVKDNSGMDKHVRRIEGNVSLNGNKVFYVIVKNLDL
jgi:hypothetical protein